jgi:hypothetical protein
MRGASDSSEDVNNKIKHDVYREYSKLQQYSGPENCLDKRGLKTVPLREDKNIFASP